MSGTVFIVNNIAGVAIVTDRSGKTGVASGVPINDLTILTTNLAAALFSDTDSFFTPIIASGTVTLAPNLCTDSDTFHPPLINYVVAPALVVDSDTIPQPLVTAIAYLFPVTLAADDAFFSPVLSGSVTLSAALFTDSDDIYAPSIARVTGIQTLLPSLVVDSETIYPAILLAAGPAQTLQVGPIFSDDAFLVPRISFLVQTLRPSLIVDPETGYPPYDVSAAKPPKETRLHAPRTNDLDVIFAARFSFIPALLVDIEIIFAPISQAIYELRAPLLVGDDAFFSPFVAMQVQAALVVDTEAIYRPLFSLFLVPQRVDDADAIPAADVGWQVIAEFTDDADVVFGVRMSAYNSVLPDVWVDEEHIDTYPFFVQQISGGIPVPKPPGILTGSVSKQRRLTGSISQPRRLTGSFANKTRRVLTGSVRRK